MWIGICPPSNRAGTWPRAFEPLVPRPAVLPLAPPSPRPTRVLAVRAPGAGRRWWTFSDWLLATALLDLLDLHEVGHGRDHAPDLGPVLLHDDVTDPLQPQRAQRL